MTFDFSKMNNIQMDVLKEIGNIGAGHAATALAKMMDKRVDMDIPRVRVLGFSEVSDILGGAEIIVAGILLKITGDITGDIMFIIKKNAAKILVSIIMGKEITEEDKIENEVFDDIEMSALKEIGNILASSYLSSLSDMTRLKMTPSIPEIAIDMAGAILSVPAIEFGKTGDTVLYIETEFSEGKRKVVGDFFLIPDTETYEILLKALGVSG
jgi:chemotaxis protein CheC